MDDIEDRELREAALKNVESILAARRRAERELLAAKEALERKTEELQQQREWFEVTLASIGDAVITTDTQGRVTFLNPIAQALTGWQSADALGEEVETVFHIVHEETRKRAENPIKKVLQMGQIVGLANHTALIARDGTEIAIEDSAAPIRDHRGNVMGVVMVFRDVTARRSAERALREEFVNRERAEAALRDADRRKDAFLATLAHELRNPLAPIRQAAVISKAREATEAQKRWSHDVIERQVQIMALLLDDLLDISRITRGRLELRPQETELAAVIDAAVETARPTIDAKRHALEIVAPPEPVSFVADPLRVAQVLSNLLTNAAKYTDPEGRIRLKASTTAEHLTLSVEDNGIGIPTHALTDVFEMFSQVKSGLDRSEGGLGIGLALSKGLVELHRGTIEAKSEGLGRGTEFLVRLPLHSARQS